MTMHGTFWKFPKTFTANSSRGILPQSNYLKVIGDFCRWNDKIVFGCDDTAKNEFLNKRKAKGEIAAPQSQSNLWFVEPKQLEHLGPIIGRGAVRMREDLKADEVSDPYLFSVGGNCGLHLSHAGKEPWNVLIETGSPREGWTKHSEQSISSYSFVSFDSNTPGAWIRLRSINSTPQACAAFTYRNSYFAPDKDVIFAGLARPGDTAGGGIVRARDKNKKTLSFASLSADGKPGGCYELDASLILKRVDDPETEDYTRSHATIPTGSLTSDAASSIFTDDAGKRWRLPKGDPFFDSPRFGGARIAREVATHSRLVHDFCSYRGLLIMSGVVQDATISNKHILRSDDGKAALWAGAIDDIWKLGKPRGQGGPWHQTKVKAKQLSDPYLLTGYDKKSLQLRFDDPQNESLNITAQIDIHGDGTWFDYQTFPLKTGETTTHEFPEAFSAYWIRFTSDEDTTTTTLIYE